MTSNKQSVLVAIILFFSFGFLVLSARHIDNAVATSTRAGLEKVVVIDAGHGGMDSGCVGVNGVLEKDINLSITLMLRDMLEASGFKVVLTRDADISIHDEDKGRTFSKKKSDMHNRLKIVNNNNPLIFVSIHQNQYTRPNSRGAQMFYSNSNERNAELAQIIQDKFVEFLQPDNKRQIKPSENRLFLLENSTVPSVMVECGFLSNVKEAGMLADEEYQKDVAFVVYCGMLEFLTLSNANADTNP